MTSSELLGGSAEEFRGDLIAAGILVSTGIDGLFGRSEVYERVVNAASALVHALPAGQGSTSISFPPVMSLRVFEQTGYLGSFPNLIGSVHSFSGSDKEHARLMRTVFAGEDWSEQLSQTELVLCPAACHPLYPTCAGRLPEGGRRFEVAGYCFRHEPSLDPARMQAFRQHEYVYVGEPETAQARHDRWPEIASEALAGLGLEVRTEDANDPFFGRAGELLADRQRKAGQKVEIVASLPAYSSSTAVSSCNWHKDHFGSEFGIQTADGTMAHSSCIGFGLDRIAIALFATHGLDPANWPEAVRARLWHE